MLYSFAVEGESTKVCPPKGDRRKRNTVAATTAGTAVRDYLVALKDPSALRDDSEIESLRKRLEESNDELERLSLRQQLMDKEKPSIERFEQAFVTHAKAWADELGTPSSVNAC